LIPRACAISITDWTGIFGFAGLTGRAVEVSGRPGAYFGGDLLGRPRFITLNIGLSRYGPAITLTEPNARDQLWKNTDDFLSYLADPLGNYLEYVLPDGSLRFTHVRALDSASISQPRTVRRISVPLVSEFPYFKAGGAQSSQVINGADTMAIGGRVTLYDPVLVFSGDGTFTHSDLGWTIQVTGSAGPVTVDLENRTVTEGGTAATNRIRRSSRDWGWFPVGTNNVLTDVSVTVTWRPSYV